MPRESRAALSRSARWWRHRARLQQHRRGHPGQRRAGARGSRPDPPGAAQPEQIGKAGAGARPGAARSWPSGRRQAALAAAAAAGGGGDGAAAPLLPPDVALEARLVPPPLHRGVDATQPQQVLTNLGTNAWHALRGRPGRIEFGWTRGAAATPGARRRACASRTRTCGCTTTAAAWIGHARARVRALLHHQAHRAGAGPGSVVHGIVVAHGGSIRIDSAPGRGTTVHLLSTRGGRAGRHWPCRARAGPVRRPAPASTRSTSTTTRLVLMVERLLVQAGYRVSTCSGGREALLRLQPSRRRSTWWSATSTCPASTGSRWRAGAGRAAARCRW